MRNYYGHAYAFFFVQQCMHLLDPVMVWVSRLVRTLLPTALRFSPPFATTVGVQPSTYSDMLVSAAIVLERC